MSFTTTNMGLTAWDQGTDHYNYTELSANWQAVDQHDHTTGKGVQIPSGGIATGAVTSTKIAANAITPSTHIVANSIGQDRMATNSIGAAQIIDGSVGSAELAAGAITYDKLDATIIPIGTVALWYRVSASISVPVGGWEVCDGRLWSAITNKMGPSGTQWNTGTIPDCRNAVIMGAATSGTGTGTSTPPDIGATGGSHTRDLSHTHTTPNHSHNVAGHAHTISADGSHKHRWQTTVWDGSNNPISTTFTDGMQRGSAVPGASGSREAFYVPDLNRNQYYGENVSAAMETVASHSHSGATGFATSTTDSVAPTTNSGLTGNTDLRPAYVGLLLIMKVR